MGNNTISSKSTSNILQHSAGGGIMMTSPDTNALAHHQQKPGSIHGGSMRPESAKKRTSFLMHSQASQGGNSNGQYPSGAQTLNSKLPGAHSNSLIGGSGAGLHINN